MIFMVVGVVFAFAMLGVSLLVFPQVFVGGGRKTKSRIDSCCRKFLIFAGEFSVGVFSGLISRTVKQGQQSLSRLVRHRFTFVGTCLLLVLPPVLVISLRGPVMLEGYAEAAQESTHDRVLIASLLRGEWLVPPLALPPQIFISREVERIRPQIATADRSWDRLDADFKQRLLIVYKVMRDRHGYEMALIEGYRSPQKQNELSQLTGVTNAGAWQSYHQYGLAADSAFVREGKLVISEKDPWAMRGYELYGEVAEELGLTWGGRWKLLDFGHVEYRKPGSGPKARR